jgi:hypothetical protein
VWESVADVARLRSVESDTGALDDVHRQAGARFDRELAALVPGRGQTGVVCVLDGRVVGMDLFDRPGTLRHYLGGIVAGHALDAGDGTVAATDPHRAVEAFLARVDAAGHEGGTGVGLGEELVLRGGVSGVGLAVDGALVHVAAFPVD